MAPLSTFIPFLLPALVSAIPDVTPVQVGAGGVHIAAVIVVCFGLDVFRQMQQVSLLTAVFGIDPTARSRLNSIMLIAVSDLWCSSSSTLIIHRR